MYHYENEIIEMIKFFYNTYVYHPKILHDVERKYIPNKTS